jgi:hypothetical protein
VESIKEMAYSRFTHKWTIGVTIKWVHKKYMQGRIAGVSLSSMGDLDALLRKAPDRPLQALSCFAGVDVGQLGPYLLVVCLTLNGKLAISVTTADPLVSDEQARRMMAGMVDDLTC